MWSGHSFGGEHEFIKNAAESHDFGTRVRYLDALKERRNKGEEGGRYQVLKKNASFYIFITSCCTNKIYTHYNVL